MALQRVKRKKKVLLIIGIILAVIVLALLGIFLAGVIGYEINMNNVEDTEFMGSRYAPSAEKVDGVWTFYVPENEDFRILQITDVHLGGGAFSIEKDKNALSAVETLIRRTAPDLVVFTGDMVYPVPPQAGSFNNLREAELLTTLMEKLGVYYAVCLGNHDTEPYSFYDRDDMYEHYAAQKYCLIDRAEGVDDVNYAINIRDEETGLIRQTLYLMDTHDYVGDQVINILGNYDGLHENQIEWYAAEVSRMNAINADIKAQLNSETGEELYDVDAVVPSTLFIHIPLGEYEDAIFEYWNNYCRDTENVTFYYGEAGENPCPSDFDDEMFETMQALGSTKWVFCGHDHLNWISLEYKGIRLTYGMSIDYLAYFGIGDEKGQRGATVIEVGSDGNLDISPERLDKNYLSE